MFENIPLELRIFKQWVCWRFEDVSAAKPTKVPYCALTGKNAKTNDPSTWCSFDEALHIFKTTGLYDGVGFVLTENDPYLFTDLDDPYEVLSDGSAKYANQQEIMDRQIKIYNEFDSYAERSPSGKGLHIISKGCVPSGRKRSAIEIYSSGRFMTMTGNVYRNTPIKDHHELGNVLWEQMGKGKSNVAMYAGLEPETKNDQEIIEIGIKAQNGEKFLALMNGNWRDYYETQSEADFALVDIVAFYSHNRAQIQRIFRMSGLGHREKAQRQDYVNYMLNKCFDRMLPPIDIEGLRNLCNEAIERKQSEIIEASRTNIVTTQEKSLPKPTTDIYSVPPGLVGEIAQFIYAQAPRPVAEIALAGALGLLSGIVGRSYNVSGTGLNQYVLLLAPTGTGKEAIAGGIDKLMNAVIRTVPAAVDFIGPGEIASSQALIKYMSKTANSFVSVVGEFGIYMQQMASLNAAPHLIGLRRMLLDLYNKSGEGKVLRPSIYSDKEKSTASVLAPAFTLMGESTPEKFYEGLHEGMMSEGFLPRFTMIEYKGKRPELNEAHASAKPSFELVERLSTICAHSLMLNSQHKAINVLCTDEADKLLKKLDKHADLNINSTDRDLVKQLWTRVHVKALKLAAVVAVGCNPYDPLITLDIASWACDLIIADSQNLLKKFEAGEIGIDNDETKQLSKLMETIKDFLTLPWSEVVKYSGEGFSNLHNERIIPYCYIQRRLAAVSIFRKDRQGSSAALKRSLKTLCERGDVQEISKATMAKDYNTTSLCFMITNAKAFNI